MQLKEKKKKMSPASETNNKRNIKSLEYLYENWFWVSLVAQMVKNLPAVQETWVPSLGGEDPLEEEMATHSSILAWRISWTEEPGGLESMGLQELIHIISV